MARNNHPEVTVNRILDVASKLFFEKGYEHTSIQDIIDNLGGLSKGAIYHHFKSKEDIMLAVVDRMYSDQDADWLKLLRDNSGLTGIEKLRAAFQQSLDNPRQNDMFSSAPDMLANSKMLTLMLKDIMEDSAPNYISPIIEQGRADGTIPTDYPLEMAQVVLILANLWLNPMVLHAGTEDMQRRFLFFRQLMAGLGADIFDNELLARLQELTAMYEQNR